MAVTKDSPNARTLTGRLRLASTAAARPGDGILQAAPVARIEAGYGYGYLGRRVTLQP